MALEALRARRRTEDGAAALEFALVMPMLFMLIFGIVTTGLSYSNALGVTNAVREGARFGATADACGATPPATCTTAGATAWSTSVIQRIRDTQFDDPGKSTRVCVQLVKVATASTTTVIVPFTCSADGATTLASGDLPSIPMSQVGTCFTRVVAARPFSINIVVAGWDRVMTRTAIARYERKDKLTQCA